ncbi:hypothetical protein J2Z64_002697 [Oceanobacillus polygoni]|uniref:Uncharacterized protein n=1 Tax=Oceanobacillus polygoni TaxID=1235259 RepID=A0A9X1CID3_9BACI|nr:hypothetical protein [Oceanobacillus polygoni]
MRHSGQLALVTRRRIAGTILPKVTSILKAVNLFTWFTAFLHYRLTGNETQ